MGAALDRPYGQDGGVVQLPLALEKIVSGESPYGADYSNSVLGRQSRVSAFWSELGGNPILRHHAYLPGTHLVMLPFFLLCRSLFGSFDPRLVTLLAYGLTVLLAARFAPPGPRRLAAAALVALNPLVYWHQVFGANDLVFVALVLGAVLLAERGKSLASGAVLGLACATKQLAWPFAPFLLVYLSGAGSPRELLSRGGLTRALRPAAAAFVVFVIVVAPLALRDWSGFYGDIFVYNAGLPGADNYPIGGTPGLGFANFLIYFGAVSSLGEYFPFSILYLLLLPLGLMLLRLQLRERAADTVLLTGSAALLAAVYFSRVVHPNYLLAVAVLVPVALLRGRRPAELAVVPLLLLVLAGDIAQLEPFRATWERAEQVGLVSSLPSALAALAPRAAPGLTSDPVSLVLSATAAGAALVYLVIGLLWNGRRARMLLAVALALALVAIPTLFVVGVGQSTGLTRSQHAWVVQVPADAVRLATGRSPYSPPPEAAPVAREAWSTSFRREPARLIAPDLPREPPGAAVLALLTGVVDPRALSLIAFCALLGLVAAAVPERARALGVGVAGLSPPLAMGVVFGAPEALGLASLLGAVVAVRQRRLLAGGALAGLAAALSHGLWIVVLLVLAAAGPVRRRFGLGVAVSYLALLAPAMLLDVSSFLASLGAPSGFEPGMGLVNLALYRGLAASTPLIAGLWLWRLAAAAFLLWEARQGRYSVAALSAVGLAAVVFLSTDATEASLAPPLLLLVLASLEGTGWLASERA